MKKILKALLMITCVLSLTACGSSNANQQLQDSKNSQAEAISDVVIELMSTIVQNDQTDELVSDYNNVELATIFENQFASYTGYELFKCEGKGIKSGLNSFKEGMAALDGFASYGDKTTKVDGDSIIVVVPVTGGNGLTGSVELIFSNDIFVKMSACTFNQNESFGSLMARAGLNTLIGMGTVFLVLILISFIISLFGYIPKLQEKKANKNKVETKVETVAVASEPEEELADDTELVAVIAAAIAAYEGTSADGFQVRSIKRANTKKWQKA